MCWDGRRGAEVRWPCLSWTGLELVEVAAGSACAQPARFSLSRLSARLPGAWPERRAVALSPRLQADCWQAH
ncbi:hypothetical protein A4R35_18210 [Thermogemmatispora tikiterensis]|uniref:Uncharacterized protein n=1 Tax=Thermogemmatispora tikiterensis TaxID=1825093 RepID=A0A328VHP9_9CHLR|nr:hypothetical protein A4R35_18210 [Thermogemmatispora tikiterensis]